MKNELLNPIEQEQLAAQVVAVMDAHFTRPTVDQKKNILKLADRQITPLVDAIRTEHPS